MPGIDYHCCRFNTINPLNEGLSVVKIDYGDSCTECGGALQVGMRKNASSINDWSSGSKQHLECLKPHAMAKYRRAEGRRSRRFANGAPAGYDGTCNCCRKHFSKGESITNVWMGWIHHGCKKYMISLNEFMLQQKLLQDLSSIPVEAHLYGCPADFPQLVEALCEAAQAAAASSTAAGPRRHEVTDTSEDVLFDMRSLRLG